MKKTITRREFTHTSLATAIGLASAKQSLAQNANTKIRVGFIGCDTIAFEIATSLAKPEHEEYLTEAGLSLSTISVTKRSASK